MKQFILLLLASALMLSSGCSPDAESDPDSPATVTLLTRSEMQTDNASPLRLLVFGSTGNNACLLNQTFTPGQSVTLDAGTYRFVTLTASDCLDLPAAGTTDGINIDGLIPLKSGTAIDPAFISQPEQLTLPGTASYTATLLPATCLLKLEVENAPAEGLTLKLQNMSAGLSLSESYAISTTQTDATSPYMLTQGENRCLPTVGNAVLQYTWKTSPATLDLGMKLEAGYVYSFRLRWQYGELKLTSSSIVVWDSNGGSTSGNAEME